MANRVQTMIEARGLLMRGATRLNRRLRRALLKGERKGNNGQSGVKQVVRMKNGKHRVVHHSK